MNGFNTGVIPEQLAGVYGGETNLPLPEKGPDLLDLINTSSGVEYAQAPQLDAVQRGVQELLNAKPSGTALAAPEFFDWDRSNIERYTSNKRDFPVLGYNPLLGQENEYRYGRLQTWGDVWSNGLTGMFKLAGNTFVEGWKGWGHIADAIVNTDASKLMGTPEELLEQDKATKDIMNKYAIYDLPEYQEGVFNRKFFGDMLQQSGFAVGTIGQFLSEELLTWGLSTQFSLAKLGIKTPSWAGRIVTKGEVAKDITNLGSSVWKSKTIPEFLVNGARKVIPFADTAVTMQKYGKAGAGALQLASIGVGGVRRFLSEANMAMTEARMEAAGTYGELYNKLYDEELFKTGEAPSADSLANMQKIAKDAAFDNFKVNTGILMLSNRLQFDNLFTKFSFGRKVLGEGTSEFAEDVLKVTGKAAIKEGVGKPLTKVYQKGALGTLGVVGEIAKDFGVRKATWEATKSAGKNIFKWEASEGLQELFQEGSNKGLTDYYYDLYHGKKGYDSKTEAIIKGIDNPFTDTQGMKTFLMGALTGRLLSPINFAVGKAKERIGVSKLDRNLRKTKVQESVQALNAFYENPNLYLPEHIANVKVQNVAAQNMQEAIANRDAYVFHNNKDSAFAKMISAAIKTDMIDSVIDTIRAYGDVFNETEFKEAFGFDKTEENVVSTKDFFNKVADNIVEFHKTWKDLKNRFGDLVIPEIYKEGTPERKIALRAKRALDDAIEMLATVDYKARQTTLRGAELQTKMAALPVLGSTAATAFRNIGVIQNTEKEIELLNNEIKNLEAQENKDKTTKDLIESKKEQLASLKDWVENYAELNNMERGDKVKSQKARTALLNYLNSKNKESQIDTVIKENQLDDIYQNLLDYIELNKDNKDYIDAYNVLANPIKFVQVHEKILDAIDKAELKKKLEHLKEIQNNLDEDEDTVVKATTTIITKDKDGKEVTFDIKEGESYITESSVKKRIYKGKTPVVYYDQDVIKIISINEDGITFSYNNEGEAVTLSVDEFSKIGKLYSLSGMSEHQRIYFKNRDVIFDLNVYAKTGKPHYVKGVYADKDYSGAGTNVKARLELVKENDEYVLKVVYINPVTKLKESIYYDPIYLKKYAANKQDILDITESEEDVISRKTEARRVSQIKMLNEAIQELTGNKEKLIAEKNKNEEDYNKVKKDLEDYIAELELIEEEFKNKPYVRGRKSKVRVELEERQNTLRNLVQTAENLIQNFEIQKINLEKQLNVLNQSLEYYSEGITELEQTGQPFTMVDGKIFSTEQQQLQTATEQQIIKPSRNISIDNITSLIDDTEAEIGLVTERISILQNIIDNANKVLARINKVTDLFDTLSGISDKKQLLNQLVLMKRQEADADNKKTIQNLINSINDGDSIELAYVFENIDRLFNSKNELSNLLDQLGALQDKYDRLALAKYQSEKISSLEKRLDMLTIVQDGILRGYQLVKEKEGVKQEGNKIITKVNSVPISDELIQGPDALFVTEPILDVIPGSEEEAETFKQMEAFAPVLTEDALYKTAGRHFADKNDTTLSSPQEARFFKFSETARLSDENGVVFYLMPITKDSKEFQELRSEGFPDDIRLVVVRRDAMGNFKPVGIDGNILENPTKDNMVYTGMHGSPELLGDDTEATYEWLKNNFAIYDKKTGKNRLTKEQAIAIANSFKQAREAIKEKVKAGETVVLPITDKSPGVYNREPLVGGYDENGNPIPQRPQELSLEGRLIEDNPDFTNLKHPDGRPVKLEISKNDTRVKSGRVMVVRPGEPPIVVYNRKFTKEEHDNVIEVLKRLSELFLQKNTDEGLSEEQIVEFQTAIKYLQGVVYWSPVQEGKEAQPFQLSVQSGLNIGKLNIAFTSKSIEDNKDKILQAIEYHKVNNTLLSDKYKTEPFYDVKVIDGKIIRGKQYVNYQHYLLAQRPGGSVLYTNIKPYTSPSENKTEPQNYQLKNVYFKYDASGFIAEPVQEVNDEPTKASLKQYSFRQSEKVINGVKFYIINSDIPIEGKVTFVTKRKNGDELYIHTEYKNGIYEIFQIIDEKGNDLTNVDVNGVPAKQNYQNQLKSSIDTLLDLIKEDSEVLENDKSYHDYIVNKFKEYFLRVEEYARQGEVMNDVKSSEVLTAPVVTPTKAAPVSTDASTKTPIEGLNERLDNYGNAKLVLSSNFYEGARPKGRLNAFKSSMSTVADNLIVLADLNLNEFDFLSEEDKKRLDALRPLAEELRKINNNDISSADRRTVAVEKRYAALTNQLANEFVSIIGKHVEQQLGKKITSSKPRTSGVSTDAKADTTGKRLTIEKLKEILDYASYSLSYGERNFIENPRKYILAKIQSYKDLKYDQGGPSQKTLYQTALNELDKYDAAIASLESQVSGTDAKADINSLIDKRTVENELTNGRYSFYPTEEAAQQNKGVVITKDNVNQAIEAEKKLGDVIYNNKSNLIAGIPTPTIEVEISSGNSLEFENAKGLQDFINNPKENAKEREIVKKKYDQLAALEGVKPVEIGTKPVGKTIASTGKTFDDFVNEKYKSHVTEAKSQGATPLSKEEYTTKYGKVLKLEYDSKVLMSVDDIIKNGLAAAEDEYDPNARFAEITSETKPEDVNKFKQWLNKVLPQISLEILDELVDGKYMGQFINGMIRMYKSAEEGTGFHEAFEAVWNAYLSPDRQQAIINEFKRRKDYKLQSSYQWAVANYKTNDENRLIKEALAEEFREYMLKEGTEVKAESPKRNTFFRKLWNFIKKLLGLAKEKVDEIQSEAEILFGQIAKGEFKNAIPVQNFDPTVAHNRAAVSGTSVEFTQQLMEGMTAIFFSKLNSESYKAKGYSIEKMFDEENNIFEELYKASWSTLYNRFMPGLKEIMKSDAFQYSSPEKQNLIIEKYRENRIAEDDKVGSNLFYQKMRAVNKEIYNSEVKQQFKNYLSQFGLKFKQIEDVKKSEEEISEIEAKENNANTLGIRDVIYIDPTSLTNPTVRLLILSLPDDVVNESGKLNDVRNKLNLPSLVSYKRKMNILLNELSNVVPMMRKQEDGSFKKTSALEEMFEKLDKKFKDPIYKFKYKDGYQWIDKLKSRLKFETLKNGGVLSNDDIKLLIAFETSFTRNRNNPLKVIVGADGKIRHVNAVSINTKEKIREEWRNGIKEKAYKVDISKLDTAGILYISPANLIEINLSSPRVKYITGASDIKGYLGAFNALGITLSTKPEKLSEADKNTIKSAYNSLKYVMDNAIKTNTSIKYDDFFGTELIAGPLNSLLGLELNFRSEDTLLSHQTADGKTQYAITLPSEISYVLHSLNSANTLEEFIMSNPQYGKIVNGTIVLNPYNSTSEILSPGGIVFDAKGRKREDAKIDYEYISGMASDKDSDGENTDRLNFNDKIVQEIYHLLRGSYFTVINADKSSEFAIKMGHFVKWNNISDLNLIEDKYINALKAEVMHALRFHFYPNNIQNHQSRILSLGHFSNIPGLEKGSNLHNYFLKLVNDTKITKRTKVENATLIFEAITENFISTVKNEGILKEYVESQVEETKEWLVKKEIVKPVEVETYGGIINRYQALGIPKDSDAIKGLDVKQMSEAELTQLSRFLVVNRQLGVYEQHKLFYGHPALYKDLAKRSSGANSQKNVISENPQVIDWMEINKPRYDGRKRDSENPIVRVTTYADPIVTSIHTKYIAEQLFKEISTKISKKKAEELIGVKFNDDGSVKTIVGGKGTYISGYVGMSEADGQAMIMPDYFRDLLYLSGSLSNEQESLLEWENASEVIERSEKSHPHYNSKYTKEQIKNAKAILEKGKPEAILQILKPQGFGFQNTDGMTHTNLLKDSVFPLTWSRVKNNPEMMSKYIDAKNQGADIIDFESGHKLGLVTNKQGEAIPFYNEDGTISTNVPILQDIFSKYFSIQVETPDYAKNAVIFGSQVRKLILSDLPESLKPFAEEYKNILNALLDIEREALLQELGLKQNEDGSYDIEDVAGLMETLRKEAIKRNLPDNVVEMLETFVIDNKEVPKYPLDANPARERIESVINSIVDGRIIRTEMFGKANVQVSSTLFSQGRKLLYLKDGKYEKVDDFSTLSTKEKKTAVLASTDLNFYNGEKPYMEVYTPWYFKGITPEKAGFVQNKEGFWVAPEGKDITKLLNSIGFRIPTSGMNMIDSIVIKGFLDPSYGDMVVVPSEMVGKSGSDFDVDKLNMFLSNYFISKRTGDIQYIKYSDGPDELDFRYNRYINDKYSDIIKPIINVINNLKQEVRDNVKQIKELEDELYYFEELIYKGDKIEGKLVSDIFNKKIKNIQQAILADEQLTLNKLNVEALTASLENAIDQYNALKTEITTKDSLEDFSKRSIESQNSKKALQNRVLEIMKTIIEHPDNQRQLLTPNSSVKLKKLSEYILNLKGIDKQENNMTKLSEWITMSETRETFITSKQLVGIGALQITSHAMSQIGEVQLFGTYKDFNGNIRKVNIKLPNSNTNKLDLSVDDDGMYIFDLFNEALTGSVDAAKDPFIFDIRLNLETASTWFYLTKRGVSQENIALMFNQPIMDDYFRYKDANNTFVNRANDEKEYFSEVVIKAASYYYTQATGKVIDEDAFPDKIMGLFKSIQNSFKNYSPQELASAISSKTLTKQQSLMQVAILMDMLDYKTQADKLSNFIRAISYDTTRTKNIVENHLQQLRYNRAVEDRFIKKDSLDRVFDKTFLGKVKDIKDDVLNMFEKFFVTLHPKSLPAFEPILDKLDDDNLFMSNEDKADLLNRYQNFFIAYILQNTAFGNNEKLSQYFNLFTDGKNESLAKRLKNLKDKYPDNVALKNLFPIINQNRLSTDNIKMFNNKMTSYDINSISESIEILYSQSEMIGDFELKEFIENLARFAILQSGVQLSPVTFTKVLPLDLYAGLTSDIFKNYINSQDVINPEQIWKAFHQNNYKNNNIVKLYSPSPKQKRRIFSQNDGLPLINTSSNITRNEYIKMYIAVEGVDTKDEKIPFDQRYKLMLYQRVKITDFLGYDVTLQKSAVKYRPINKLGNGMYLVETTPDPITNASRFQMNGDIYESMYNETVMAWKQQLSITEMVGESSEFDKLPKKSTTPTMTYAGIGSRQTPKEVLDQMTEVAKELQSKGFTLNTGITFGGKEEGADAAFSKGTTKKNLFAPEQSGERETLIANEIHPAPDRLSEAAMKLMARNTNQVFGENLDTPVDFVLFWATEVPGSIRPEGGTGQAVEMARRKGIPTINMQDADWRDQLDRVLNPKTAQPSTSVQQKPLGKIALNIIEDWVQSGQATTTVRNSSYHNSFYKGDGVYTTDKGNLVNITHRGLVKLQGDNVVGNGFSYTKDEFAKAEGFGTWANFEKGAKYAGKTLMDGGSVHLYNITPATKVVQPSTSVEKINIYAGTGENAELSNFANRPFKLGDGVTYPTVEHAFQLQKLEDSRGAYTESEKNELFNKALKMSAAQVKAFGGTIKGLDIKRWDEDASMLMKDLIKQSFEANPQALRKLLATGKAELTHTQDKGKWGTEFPKLLMEVREELRSQQPTSVQKIQPEGLPSIDNNNQNNCKG